VQSVDPRARRSRSALEAALRELIAERDLTKISISDVTKHADVNRSTFYEHYTDLADLAAAACTALFDEFVVMAPVSAHDPSTEQLPKLFAHVAEHAHLYRTLLGADGSARVINHLLHRIATTATHVRRGAVGDAHDPAGAFIAGALLGTVIDWLERDCPGTPEEVGAAILPHLVAASGA
jgi:AcrR family transcriptional regulator